MDRVAITIWFLLTATICVAIFHLADAKF